MARIAAGEAGAVVNGDGGASAHGAVRVDVAASSRASTVWIGDGVLDRLGSILDAHAVGRRRFVVSNPTIWRLHGARVGQALGGVDPILIPDGERYKTMRSVGRIHDALIRAGADRGSALVAVGGGVVGDTAGFAAASFLRGITLAHVPSTLLAQVDSSIGGKVGVNHPLGKNLIGAFHQPAVVVADPSLLATLPRREFRSGLYEVVKYGMIASPALFRRLATDTAAVFARGTSVLGTAIVESCRIKANVVAEDEHEGGLRRILNYGHTIGHALEAVTHYRRFRHGEAIAYGMLGAADMAVARGVMPDADRQALDALLSALGPRPPVSDLSVRGVVEAIRRDKKVLDGTLHFVLVTTIGTTSTVSDVTEGELEAVLRRMGLVAD